MTIGTLNRITVQITEEEYRAFQQFQRILPDVVVMIDAGLFDFKGGSAIIHRDAGGKLQMVIANWPIYRAPHR